MQQPSPFLGCELRRDLIDGTTIMAIVIIYDDDDDYNNDNNTDYHNDDAHGGESGDGDIRKRRMKINKKKDKNKPLPSRPVAPPGMSQTLRGSTRNVNIETGNVNN